MYKNVLVPIDVYEAELTNMVIPHVEAIAKIEDAKFHFVAVVPMFPYYGIDGMPPVRDIQDKVNNKVNAKLDEITGRFNLPPSRIKTHLANGIPRDEIMNLAVRISADLIIIGSRRPSITTYLLGSTAAAVVRHAKTSVLVVR